MKDLDERLNPRISYEQAEIFSLAKQALKRWKQRNQWKNNVQRAKDVLGFIETTKNNLHQKFSKSYFKLACRNEKKEAESLLEQNLNVFVKQELDISPESIAHFQEIKIADRRSIFEVHLLEEQTRTANDWDEFF